MISYIFNYNMNRISIVHIIFKIQYTMVYGTLTSAKIDSFLNAKKYKTLWPCHWRDIRRFIRRFCYSKRIYSQQSQAFT